MAGKFIVSLDLIRSLIREQYAFLLCTVIILKGFRQTKCVDV